MNPANRLNIEWDWRYVGPIVLQGDRLVFPKVSEAPGVYRFRLNGSVYIGESTNLRRRFNGYRNPGPTQQTNQRMNPVIAAAVSAGAAELEVVGTATVNGVEYDPSLGPARLLVENAALIAAAGDGEKVLNR